MLLSGTVSSLPFEHQRSGCSNSKFCYFALNSMKIVVIQTFAFLWAQAYQKSLVLTLHMSCLRTCCSSSHDIKSQQSHLSNCACDGADFWHRTVCFPCIGYADSKNCSDNLKIAILYLPMLLKLKQKLMHMVVLIDSIQMQLIIIDCFWSQNMSAHHVPVSINQQAL